MTSRRLVVPSDSIVGNRATLTGPQHHYLCHVLRLKRGDPVLLLDETGARHEGHIGALDPRQVVVELTSHLAPEPTPTPRLVLVYGLSRRTKTEWVLQKATELGVDWVLPASTERSVSRPADGARRLERWLEIVAQASRQCGRTALPLLSPAQPYSAALGQAAAATDCRVVATPEGRPLAEHAGAIAGAENRAVAMAVGPEGGFTALELDQAREHGFRPVSLGPRVLRTETAALALLALVAHLAHRM